jgi:hypothetical protein
LPTHKPDLSRFSLTQLRELTGHSERTIRKRLAGLEPVATDGRTVWYTARAALERIYLGESLDLSRERARLARAQSETVERRNAVEAGELGEWAAFDRVTAALATSTRDKMLAIAHEIAPAVAADGSTGGCYAKVDFAIRRALSDLADEGDAAIARLQQAEAGRPG